MGIAYSHFFAWQAAATRLKRRHGGPLEILRFFWNVGRVYHSLQLAEEFHYATNPCLLPMKIFWNKIFLNGTFLRYVEMYLRSFGSIEKYYLTKSRIVCNYDLHTSSLMLLLRCLFSHSKHVLFSLTHWYFLVRTFFRPKMLFCASICFPWNYYCIMENNAYLKIQEVGSLNGNCVWRRYTMLRRATRNDNLTPHKHGHMTFL